MDCVKCIKEQEFKELERRVQKVESDNRLQTYQYEQIMKTLEEVKADVTEMKNIPNKRWDVVITGIISAIVGCVMALVLK